MSKRIIVAAVLALALAAPVAAQNIGQQGDVIETNRSDNGKAGNFSPAPPPAPPAAIAPAPAPKVAAPSSASCTIVQERLPPIAKPAKYWIAVFAPKAEQAAFLASMQKCHGEKTVKERNSKFVSVDAHVVSDTDGWATFKVPTEHKATIFVTFSSNLPEFAAAPFWKSEPFGDQVQVELAKVDPKQVVGNRP